MSFIFDCITCKCCCPTREKYSSTEVEGPRSQRTSFHVQRAKYGSTTGIVGRTASHGAISRVENPDLGKVFNSFKGKTIRVLLCKKADSTQGLFVADISQKPRHTHDTVSLVFEMNKATVDVSPDFLNGSFTLRKNENGNLTTLEGGCTMVARGEGRAQETQRGPGQFSPYYQNLFNGKFSNFVVYRTTHQGAKNQIVLTTKTDFAEKIYGAEANRVAQLHFLHVTPLPTGTREF